MLTAVTAIRHFNPGFYLPQGCPLERGSGDVVVPAKGPGREATTIMRVVPRLRMSGVVSSLRHTP